MRIQTLKTVIQLVINLYNKTSIYRTTKSRYYNAVLEHRIQNYVMECLNMVRNEELNFLP